MSLHVKTSKHVFINQMTTSVRIYRNELNYSTVMIVNAKKILTSVCLVSFVVILFMMKFPLYTNEIVDNITGFSTGEVLQQRESKENQGTENTGILINGGKSTTTHSPDTVSPSRVTLTEGKVSPQPYTGTGNKTTIKLILATYYRGGSTFVGEMLNYNPEAFYMFEPLMVPYNEWGAKLKMFGGSRSMYFAANGSVMAVPQEALDELADVVLQILNCEFENMNPKILSHYFLVSWMKSKSVVSYRNCYRRVIQERGEVTAIKKCISFLKEECTNRTIRSMKVIRMAGMLAERVLQRDPSVKIVYYTRDPRGLIVSQASLGGVSGVQKLNNTHNVVEMSSFMCQRLRHDMVTFDRLADSYSVLKLRYEDLAYGPDDTVNTLYKFIGEEVPDEVRSWIKDNTEADNANGLMGTRRNSSAVAERWRTVLSPAAVKTINDYCNDTLQYLHYPL